jgi:hypothetical protein
VVLFPKYRKNGRETAASALMTLLKGGFGFRTLIANTL